MDVQLNIHHYCIQKVPRARIPPSEQPQQNRSEGLLSLGHPEPVFLFYPNWTACMPLCDIHHKTPWALHDRMSSSVDYEKGTNGSHSPVIFLAEKYKLRSASCG